MASDGSEPTPKTAGVSPEADQLQKGLRGEGVGATDEFPDEALLHNKPPPESGAFGQLGPDEVRLIYEEHGRELCLFLGGVLKSSDQAHDLVQIVFRKLLEVGHSVQRASVKGWLFRVGFHEAMALRRRQASQGKGFRNYLNEHLEGSHSVESPLQIVIRDEDVQKIRRLLAELPPDQQHVVKERIYQEKTFATIANELGVPLGTVLTRMRLAMEKLTKWMTPRDQ